MELPQPHSFGTQGRKPTHDFLSLYSPAHQHPILAPQGEYLETYDLLQPLEKTEKPLAVAPPSTGEHILSGGIGNYRFSHVSYINQSQSSSSERNDENGFTLWEETSEKKGKTGKENIVVDNSHLIEEGSMKNGGVTWSRSQSPSSSHLVKAETNHGQRPNILRSKHSATEQRRRSKINDRFSMLREIIPHGDQKRDKASFLLEVVEYIQFLQEKVHMYESGMNSHGQRHQLTDCSGVCDKLKDQGLLIENGTISISTIYSQGLLSSLTEALQSSGVELSQANMSVKIDFGKRANPSMINSVIPDFKKTQNALEEDSNKALKRLKPSIN